MTSDNYMALCKAAVVKYFNSHSDVTDGKTITLDDVYIVWFCKTLQNMKVLASTTVMDGMYYELTYNGDKDEIYLDAYKKRQNIVIKPTDMKGE